MISFSWFSISLTGRSPEERSAIALVGKRNTSKRHQTIAFSDVYCMTNWLWMLRWLSGYNFRRPGDFWGMFDHEHETLKIETMTWNGHIVLLLDFVIPLTGRCSVANLLYNLQRPIWWTRIWVWLPMYVLDISSPVDHNNCVGIGWVVM